jgi:methyl-accepting chemotaxis protein
MPDRNARDRNEKARPQGVKAPGLTIAQKLVIAFLAFILVQGALLVVIYWKTVPPLVVHQVELRVESLARAFASSSLKPVLERDYLLVNKLAEETAKLPDVAYAAAVNDRGIAIAGILGTRGGFDASFMALFKQRGFPAEIVAATDLAEGMASAKKRLMVGGQEVIDFALRLPQTNSVVHVGLLTAEMRAAERATLTPLVILLAVMAAVGILTLSLVARTVSRPIRQLAEQAEQVSMGQLLDEIEIKAGGEIWLLAESFKRMQASIRYAMMQMRRAQQKS